MEKKTLREFVEGAVNVSAIGAMPLAVKLVELESIENWMRLMYDVELEVHVVPTQVEEGRWYGKSLAEKLKK